MYACTGWRRLIGSPKLQIIFHKRVTKCRALLRKMTYSDKGSYESSPPCMQTLHIKQMNLARIWGIQRNLTLRVPLYTTTLLCMQTLNVKKMNLAKKWGTECNVTLSLPLYRTTRLCMQTLKVKKGYVEFNVTWLNLYLCIRPRYCVCRHSTWRREDESSKCMRNSI